MRIYFDYNATTPIGPAVVDAMTAAAKRKLDAIVDQPLAVRARAGADFIEQRHRALFQKAGADAAEHIFRRLAFQDDVVDA